MPQMAPMWWSILMLEFSIMLLMMMTMFYFKKNNKMIKINKKNKMMKWKW
nr:ATP synthase F0 subunit 8 [Batracomorphus curvatus]WHE42602.1 ATP synthase F0 subunit 8 [Batracomorphus curvatus]